MNNFVVIESIHGKFIVNRHCSFQAEALIKTGATHIENELKNIYAVINILPEESVALDAGANIGFVCVPIANWLKNKNGKVYAFEPQKMLYNALCGTASLNDLDNLIIENIAIGSNKGQLKIPKQDYSKPKDFGMVSLTKQEEISNYDNVKVTSIDNLNLNRLDFLKIDVEGMEIEVLSGAKKTIQQYRPWCWIEYWMIDKNLLINYFKNLNYKIFTMDKLNVLCAPEDKLKESKLNVNAPLFNEIIPKKKYF
jgi:FkbM family methyltransferase